MMVISDSVHTHGLPDGNYQAEGYDIVVKNGVSRLVDGTLDGGGAYVDEGVRNLVSIGIPMADALTMASMTPADRIGLRHGIEAGCPAHLTLWDEQLKPVTTLVQGETQWRS
jgi:N-acetylglucosamine-6-phosphate deacetylase